MFDLLNASAPGLGISVTTIAAAARSLPDVSEESLSVLPEQAPGISWGGVEILKVGAVPRTTHLKPGEFSVDPARDEETTPDLQLIYCANALAIPAQDQSYGTLINILDTQQAPTNEDDVDSVL
jgi:hypothetical protein